VPAAIAVQLSNPALRPLVLVGDGAFQMTGMELSTAVRYGLNPIVVVLNNHGYGTERPMVDGPFNDVLSWQYSRLPEVLGSGTGYVVKTEEQLAAALTTARAYTESFSILDVQLEADDLSPALRRLTTALANKT
jgi:TPP-dependent 2-oxoacid decarboxylase